MNLNSLIKKRRFDLPPSSVEAPVKLPDENAPPWICLAEPGAPVVLRRYIATSRTCDVISRDGRWLLESALIPRTGADWGEILYGIDVACGDVEPGWTIVYVGHEIWFPQRVVQVEAVSPLWQRVWTLSDAETRDIWDLETERGQDMYEWDNGFVTKWSFDDMQWPMWSDGPWYPLQSEPLSEDVRRFVLNQFGIAVECPACGSFGKPIAYGLPAFPLGPNVIVGGCGIGLMEPDYGCDCGNEWSVTRQGRVLPAGEIDFDDEESGDLNYDEDDVYPYGRKVEFNFQDLTFGLLAEAGAAAGLSRNEDGYVDYPEDMYVFYVGRGRYDSETLSAADDY